MDKDYLAKILYNAYCEGVGGVAYNGDKLPTANEFFNDDTKKKQADAWRIVSDVASSHFLSGD